MSNRIIQTDQTTHQSSYKSVPSGDLAVWNQINQYPKLSVSITNNGLGNGSAPQNTYIFGKGAWVVNESHQFTLTPTSNQITYTGSVPIVVEISYHMCLFSSTNGRYIWSVFVKNPTADTYAGIVPPNLPVGSVSNSLIKGLGGNLTANMTTEGGSFTVQMNPNDVLRLYACNVSNGDSTQYRDLSIVINTIKFL